MYLIARINRTKARLNFQKTACSVCEALLFWSEGGSCTNTNDWSLYNTGTQQCSKTPCKTESYYCYLCLLHFLILIGVCESLCCVCRMDLTHWSIMFGSNSDDCLLMYAHTMYASTVNAPHVPQCCWPHLVFPFKRIGIICEFWGEMIMIIIIRGEKIWHRTWGVCHIKKSGNIQGH